MALSLFHLKKGRRLTLVKFAFALLGVFFIVGVWALWHYQEYFLKEQFRFYILFLSILSLFLLYYIREIKKSIFLNPLLYEKALVWIGFSALNLGHCSLATLVLLYVGQTIFLVKKSWKVLIVSLLGGAGILCLKLSLHELTSQNMVMALSIHVPWLAYVGYLLIVCCFLCGSQLSLFSLVNPSSVLALFHNSWTFILLNKVESEFFYSFSHGYVFVTASAFCGITSILSLHPLGIFASCLTYCLSCPSPSRFVLIYIYGIGVLGLYVGNTLKKHSTKEKKQPFLSIVLPGSPIFLGIFYSFKECIEHKNLYGLLFFLIAYTALLFHSLKAYAPIWVRGILRYEPSDFSGNKKNNKIDLL